MDRKTLLAVLALGMAGTVGLGIARFAYALVLPAMRSELGWSYSQAGWLNTTNAVGYLFGALLAARAVDRSGARAVTVLGAATCVVSLAACGVLTDFVSLNLARVLAGLGGAFAFVGGGVLAARLAEHSPSNASRVLGIYYASPGLGIALSGLVVPFLLKRFGFADWHLAWWALAGLCVPLVAWLVLGTRGSERPVPVRRSAHGRHVPAGWFTTGYFLFGAGYIGYMTFMVARVRDGGGSAVDQGLFWATIGLGAVCSAWVWRGVMDRLSSGRAFGLLCLLTACGAAIPVALDGVVFLFLSAALFGSAFFAVVASTTVFVRRNYPHAAWASGIGRMTVAFGAGQIVGPIGVGWVNDLAGGLSLGLGLSAALLAVGAGLAAAQRDRLPASRA